MFVFGASGRSVASEAWRFTLVNLVSMALVWLISVGLARVIAFPAIGFTWYADDIAHFIGVLVARPDELDRPQALHVPRGLKRARSAQAKHRELGTCS